MKGTPAGGPRRRPGGPRSWARVHLGLRVRLGLRVHLRPRDLLRRLPLVIVALAAARPGAAVAQELELRGYYLNVATGSLEGELTPSGISDFQRLRLMSAPSLGPVTADVAYEHSLSLVSDPALGFLPTLGETETGTLWLPLQWTIAEGKKAEWRHRFDRLLVGVPLGEDYSLDVGRQPISWATTLFLTPADPFAPFDPADPFREYRGGVDAARVRGFLGAFTSADGVLRLADTRDGTSATALGRVQGVLGRWELSGWAGIVYEEAAAAAAATLTAAGAAFRGELVVRDADGFDDPVMRFAVGADRSFPVGGRDLYVAVEYQHDGFGAAGADELLEVVLSDPFSRGEMQVLGRDEMAVQGSCLLHPLLTGQLLWLWNLNDRSALLAPAVGYSLSDEVSARAGIFVGIGRASTDAGLPGSEYGATPTSLYLSLTAFF